MVHNIRSFNPINHGFEWTQVEGNGWYRFDSEEAHRTAKLERNEFARGLKSAGATNVHKSQQKNCLMKRGGIGSGHPEIEVIVTVYEVTWEE